MEGTIILNRKGDKNKPQEEDDVIVVPEVEVSEPELLVEDTPVKQADKIPEIYNPNEQAIVKNSVLTDVTQKYIYEFKDAIEKDSAKVASPIYVDELASRLAKFYEKARRVIDWKEEHLVRRTAIERVLKRRLLSKVSGIYLLADATSEEMAEPIVMELVRSGYFENGKISRDVIDSVRALLEKYIIIMQNNPLSKENLALNIKRKVEIYNWIIETAACEIEEVMEPPRKYQALLNYMCNVMEQRIRITPENKISDEDKKIQILVSVQRTLFDMDDVFINYSVLKKRYPEIFGASNTEETLSFAKNLLEVWKILESDMSHVYAPHFYKIADKYDAVYRVLGDVLDTMKENPLDITDKMSDKNSLGSMIGEVYNNRVATLKKRLFRSAIYSTLSIFLAGGVSLYLVEVPLAKLVYGEFSPFALFVDLAIPALFMFLLVMLIRPPAKQNFGNLLTEIEKTVYREGSTDIYEIRLDKKKSKILNAIFLVLYLVLGFSSLYLVFWVFDLAKVPWTSLYIDTLNVAVVVFTAVVIKQRSKEITLEDGGNLWSFIIDMISLPLAKIGAWLAQKWKEYNFVSVFFTVLVDTPFATLIATIEDWRTFIKEKRAEIH